MSKESLDLLANLAILLVSGLGTLLVLRRRANRWIRELRQRYDAGEFVWGARVRFGADRYKKAEAGTLVLHHDGSVDWTPTSAREGRLRPPRTWPPGTLTITDDGPRRDISGVRMRCLVLAYDGRRDLILAFGECGRLPDVR